MPVVVMYSESHLPRSTTLVSPVTTGTPARAAASAIAGISASQHVGGQALLEDQRRRQRQRAGAADTARSLTVPLTASSPIEPPGNRIGRHDEGVGGHRQPRRRRPSAGRRRRAAPAPGSSSSGTISPSTSARLALPPAPCAIVMRSSRNRCGRRRIASMRSPTSSSVKLRRHRSTSRWSRCFAYWP